MYCLATLEARLGIPTTYLHTYVTSRSLWPSCVLKSAHRFCNTHIGSSACAIYVCAYCCRRRLHKHQLWRSRAPSAYAAHPCLVQQQRLVAVVWQWCQSRSVCWDPVIHCEFTDWDDDARAHTLYNTKIRCSGTTDRHTCVCFRRRHPYASCTIIATTESVTKSRVCRGNLYANYITTSQEAQTLVSGFCGWWSFIRQTNLRG
jgi:hypothetical protein